MAVDVHSTYITTNQQQHKCTSYQYSPSFTAQKIRLHKFAWGKYGAKRSNHGGNQTRQRW